jgi:hypothetical protein
MKTGQLAACQQVNCCNINERYRLVTTVIPNSPSLAGYLVGLAVAFVGFTACSNGISLPSASTQ